jgi:tetratricopeptide (TPR) repeat protein
MSRKRVLIPWIVCGMIGLSLSGCQNRATLDQPSQKSKSPLQWVSALLALIKPAVPDTAGTLQAQAQHFETMQQYALAERYYHQALTIRESAWGAAHLKVTPGLDALAAFYTAQGRYPEAAALWQRAMAIREQTFGPDHPEVAETLSKYALLLRHMQRSEEAGALEQRLQTMRGK